MSDILLLSGGIDSAALAAWYRPDLCITVDYGQRAAAAEASAAKSICEALALRHENYKIQVPQLGAGDMSAGAPCRHSQHSEFWPFRNQFLVTLAAMRAMQCHFERILIGSVSTDVRHKDGRKEFIEQFGNLLEIQEGGLRLMAPAISMTSLELVQASGIPMEVLAWSHSCHLSDFACGSCKGCIKHSEIMAALGYDR